MRRDGTTLLLLTLCLCAGYPTMVHARGLLGERYADVFIGFTEPGDEGLAELDDTILLLGGDLNWPLVKGFDLHVDVGHERFDGTYDFPWGDTDVESTATSVLVGVNVQLRPGENVNPFLIGRFGIVATSFEETESMGTESWNDTGGAIMLGGGIEFEVGPAAALRPSLVYQRFSADGEDVDDGVLGLDANLWFAKNVFGLGGLAIGLSEGDLSLFAGVGLGF